MKGVWIALGAVGAVGAIGSRRKHRGSSMKYGNNTSPLGNLFDPKNQANMENCMRGLHLWSDNQTFLGSLTDFQKMVWKRTGKYVCPHGLEILNVEVETGWRTVREGGARGMLEMADDFETEQTSISWNECGHPLKFTPNNPISSILAGKKDPRFTPLEERTLFVWHDDPHDAEWE